MALENRRSSATDINKSLSDAEIKVSDQTVRRRLVPRKKPFLNAVQREKRLKWAKEHASWTVEAWKRVLWSDETHISIFGSDGVWFLRRRPGEDCIAECTTATMKHPLSIKVWGCMCRDGVGRLQVLNGMVNAEKYVKDVLQSKLLASARDILGAD